MVRWPELPLEPHPTKVRPQTGQGEMKEQPEMTGLREMAVPQESGRLLPEMKMMTAEMTTKVRKMVPPPEREPELELMRSSQLVPGVAAAKLRSLLFVRWKTNMMSLD